VEKKVGKRSSKMKSMEASPVAHTALRQLNGATG
jgi:hypothetical protein